MKIGVNQEQTQPNNNKNNNSDSMKSDDISIEENKNIDILTKENK